ncbi:polyketide synthase dehydratase domain-containing protein, partial [Frankia sp. R82]|uniref:polyketide synthase dehydratase domain-containing protein n=1 Tax=Frankia sp. R82 TaxID=2950553 RepID=UPI0020442A83
PFQHERFWLANPPRSLGDLSRAGLRAAGHPLLAATVRLAADDTVVLTGRLSLATHPWLADHTVQDAVVLPGTAHVDLALRAGDELGAELLDELVVEAPLVLPARGAVAIQVSVTAPDEAGRRTVSVHSRPDADPTDPTDPTSTDAVPTDAVDAVDGADPTATWTRHAVGTLRVATTTAPVSRTAALADPAAWPPPGATAVDVTDGYDLLTGSGLAYGPTFQGLRAAWRDGDHLYAEVVLPESTEAETDGRAPGQADGFGIHPALLDAAFHAAALHRLPDVPDGHSRLPFAWDGIRLHATGATALRVHVTLRGPDEVALQATDPTGTPVITIGSLVSRLVSAAQVASARPDAADGAASDDLFAPAWQPLTSVPPGEPAASAHPWAVLGEHGSELVTALTATGLDVRPAPDLSALAHPAPATATDPGTTTDARTAARSAPDVVVLNVPADGAVNRAEVLPELARVTATDTLAVLQDWLDEAHPPTATLIVLTSSAVSVDGEAVDLATAGIGGLVRTAATENPGRFLHVDTDADPASLAARPGAVAARGHQRGQTRSRRVLAGHHPRPGAPVGLRGEPQPSPAMTDGNHGATRCRRRHPDLPVRARRPAQGHIDPGGAGQYRLAGARLDDGRVGAGELGRRDRHRRRHPRVGALVHEEGAAQSHDGQRNDRADGEASHRRPAARQPPGGQTNVHRDRPTRRDRTPTAATASSTRASDPACTSARRWAALSSRTNRTLVPAGRSAGRWNPAAQPHAANEDNGRPSAKARQPASAGTASTRSRSRPTTPSPSASDAGSDSAAEPRADAGCGGEAGGWSGSVPSAGSSRADAGAATSVSTWGDCPADPMAAPPAPAPSAPGPPFSSSPASRT